MPEPQPAEAPGPGDTSYLCVIDKDGNAFSCTPSDGSDKTPIIPGVGILCSGRGTQSWADPTHPSSVAPGKRPRLTPNPAMAFKNGKVYMPFGTPGGDVQPQAMLQVFLNVNVFGMDPQSAIEAPRFANYSYPGLVRAASVFPGRLYLESRIDKAGGRGAREPRTRRALVARVDVACGRGVHDRRGPQERRAPRRRRCAAAGLRAGLVTRETLR